MRDKLICFGAVIMALMLAANPANAIQTDIFPDDPSARQITLKKEEASAFDRSRSRLEVEISQFEKLASKAQAGVSGRLNDELRKTLSNITRHAKIVRELSAAANYEPGIKIASRMIIDDDITGKIINDDVTGKIIDDDVGGRLPAIQSTAKLLRDLSDTLALIRLTRAK